MQVVDILRDEQQVSVPLEIQSSERIVGGVRLDLAEARATGVVEFVD